MPSKYGDSVLVSSCMRHSNVITKEPFTHESLLIDKKEYQLSELEKEMALKEYQYDKRYFPYTKQGSLLYYQRLSFAENPVLSQFHGSASSQSLMTSNTPYPYGLPSRTTTSSHRSGAILGSTASSSSSSSSSKQNLDFSLHKSASSDSLIDKLSMANQNNRSADSYHNSMTPTLMKCLNTNPLLEKLASSSPSPSSKGSPQSQSYSNSNSNSNAASQFNATGPGTDDFYITGSYPTPNSNGQTASNQQSQSQPQSVSRSPQQQQQSQNLRDVKISRFVTNSPIVIPANSSWVAAPSSGASSSAQPNEMSSGLVIPAGEQVVFLKTPKGCYLRTSDGKYIAIRNRSLLESVVGASSASTEMGKRLI